MASPAETDEQVEHLAQFARYTSAAQRRHLREHGLTIAPNTGRLALLHDQAHAAAPGIEDGGELTLGGRRYRLVLGAPNCASIRHYHHEDHADGTPGGPAHHHHEARCADVPRQATLYPVGPGTARHVHAYQAGTCQCGATRTVIAPPRPPGGKQTVAYQMPADADHPAGWSYQRNEDR